ncbi:hypothetical protein [Klebsiella pneumoniae]
MAHQTPSSSLKKHPRSLRLILAELFSGRVSVRLSELEEKVGQMEHRLDDHAVAISNLGGSCGNGGSDEDPNRKNPARHLGACEPIKRAWRAQMDQFQRKRLLPMAYGLITICLAAVAIPSTQALLMPDSCKTVSQQTPAPVTESTPSITTMPRSATLDGMRLDSIPQVRPATPDLPPAATEVMA